MKVVVTAGTPKRGFFNYQVPLTVTAADATSGSGLGGASVTLSVYSGSNCSGSQVGRATSTTGSAGQAGFTFTARTVATWCALAVVTDAGYTNGSGQTTFNS